MSSVFILQSEALDMVEACADDGRHWPEEKMVALLLPYAQKTTLDPDVKVSYKQHAEVRYTGGREISRLYLEVNLHFTNCEEVWDTTVEVDILKREVRA